MTDATGPKFEPGDFVTPSPTGRLRHSWMLSWSIYRIESIHWGPTVDDYRYTLERRDGHYDQECFQPLESTRPTP